MEEKIDTQIENRKPKRYVPTHNDRIVDARSENRKQFTQIKMEDPRERLKELPFKQAKDRRQSKIVEFRNKRMEENKGTQLEEKRESPKQFQNMIKEITLALNEFMETTNKEIENIKKMVDLNFRGFYEEQKEFKKYKEDVKIQMQNIIVYQKELNQKWEAIGSLVEGIIEGTSQTTQTKSNLDYSKYKKDIKENIKRKFNYEVSKRQIDRQPASKAVLYDRYIPNKARIVTNLNGAIRTYKVSINYKYGYKVFYVNYKNKWNRLRDVIESLRLEGLVYGFRNIINTLRLRNNKFAESLKTSTEKKKIDDGKWKKELISNQ